MIREGFRLKGKAAVMLLFASLSVLALSGCPTGAGGTSAEIALSTATLSYSAANGGANPAAQTVTISNSGGGSLTGLSASVSYGSGSGWLTAALNVTTAPATLTVQPSTGSLTAGSYTATISVSSSLAGITSQTVSVTFTVAAAPPSIGLSSTSRSFSATAGGANPNSQTVSVTNPGGGTLSGLSASVSYSSGTGWLNATLNVTTAPATLTVQPSTGSLTAGSYTATISVSSRSCQQ
jgi:hypothetical protein